MSDLEAWYWGNCANTFYEDQKHYVYAKYMALDITWTYFDVHGRSIVDIGGGPTSMLLKCRGLGKGLVVDPLQYPYWTFKRYTHCGIDVSICRGEDFTDPPMKFDEAWIYNCLQHVDDARLIIQNAKNAANRIRIFEWVDIPPHDGHPIELTKDFLDDCLGGEGSVIELAESGCYGRAYYGVFEYI
jgi:hypothetical protein